MTGPGVRSREQQGSPALGVERGIAPTRLHRDRSTALSLERLIKKGIIFPSKEGFFCRLSSFHSAIFWAT